MKQMRSGVKLKVDAENGGVVMMTWKKLLKS